MAAAPLMLGDNVPEITTSSLMLILCFEAAQPKVVSTLLFTAPG
jgi:hypothetical protein